MEGQSVMKMHEFEMGLPSSDDLIPLTQSLISPQLAHAFGIVPEPSRTLQPLTLFPTSGPRRPDNAKDEIPCENGSGRAVKRPRLVWTSQLHKRFVDVIEHLGIDKAVPKTIMEMMNVEGLTRENVASHLQKYRLYLKRTEQVSGETHSDPRRVPSFMDFDGVGSGPGLMQPARQSCDPLPFLPMPTVFGPASGLYGFGHLGFPAGASVPSGYCGLESGGSFHMVWSRQRG